MPCVFTIDNNFKLPKIFCEEIKNPSSKIIWTYCENGFPLSRNTQQKNFFDQIKNTHVLYHVLFQIEEAFACVSILGVV